MRVRPIAQPPFRPSKTPTRRTRPDRSNGTSDPVYRDYDDSGDLAEPTLWYHLASITKQPGAMGLLMATKPTKSQQQGCDQLAEALLLITSGARLDGRGKFDATDLTEVALRLAKACSAFTLDDILARAIEGRARALGLRSGTSDLLMLMEGDIRPLETLLLPDEAFMERTAKMEDELGVV